MALPKLVLEDNEKFALMKFRRKVQDVTKPHHDDYFLVRWLRARSWDTEAAEKMLRESLQWRKFWGVDDELKSWEPPEALGRYYPSGSTGCDSDGCPVLFVPFSGLDVVGILHSVSKQDCVRMTIKVLEEHLNTAAETGANKVVVVFDMVGFNLKDYAWRPVVELVISLLKMYEANYPEILKACYIINAPAVFAVAFSVVKRFLNEYTLGKIGIYKSDPRKWTKALRENIPVEILPKHFGGELVDPDGDPKCPSKIRPGGKIPKSYYTMEKNTDEIDFVTAVVKKGKKLTLDYIVAENGCTLRWEFHTDGHDIRFGITYCDEEGNTCPAIHFQRVASNGMNETGMINCQAPATYTVVFDNSYSLMRNKKISYNIVLSPPITQFETAIEPDNIAQTNGQILDNNGSDSNSNEINSNSTLKTNS